MSGVERLTDTAVDCSHEWHDEHYPTPAAVLVDGDRPRCLPHFLVELPVARAT